MVTVIRQAYAKNYLEFGLKLSERRGIIKCNISAWRGSHGHVAFHRNYLRNRAHNETKSRAFALVIYKMLKALADGDRPSTGL